jgi:hypothetical protein
MGRCWYLAIVMSMKQGLVIVTTVSEEEGIRVHSGNNKCPDYKQRHW